jgi:hypothetical protein
MALASKHTSCMSPTSLKLFLSWNDQNFTTICFRIQSHSRKLQNIYLKFLNPNYNIRQLYKYKYTHFVETYLIIWKLVTAIQRHKSKQQKMWIPTKVAKISNLPQAHGLLSILFLEAQSSTGPLASWAGTNRAHKSPVIVHFCQAFPGTFLLDLKPDSLPWALYVTKGKWTLKKVFPSQASGFCLTASKDLGFWIQANLLWL